MPEELSSPDAASATTTSEPCPVKNRWLRRIGAAGFMFFLIKGLLWLTVPAALAIWRGCAV